MTHSLAVLLKRPIAFHPVFSQISGSITAGLFLSQLFYWHDKGSDPDGWIYKTYEEWKEETTMTRYELDGARKKLKSLGLIEEKRCGQPARLFYRIDFDAVQGAIELSRSANKIVENQQSRVGKTSNLELGKPASNQYTENTTEITAESGAPTAQSVEVVGALIPVVDPLAVGRKQKGSAAAADFEQFRTAYNENRPRFWPEMQVVNPKRQKLLKELIRDCGGISPAIAALTNALKYASGDSWYSSKTLNFENFASNGKILQLHERFLAQFDSGIPAVVNTAANRETALEVQRLAAFLQARQEAKQ